MTLSWATVQASLDANSRRHAGRGNRVARAPLTGRLFDADGHPMSPAFAYGRGGKLYRYYVSASLQQGERRCAGDDAIRRVRADALETLLRDLLNRIAPAHASEDLDLLARIEIHASSLQLLMPLRHLPAVRTRLADDEHVETDPVDPSRLRLAMPIRARFHGGRTAITAGAETAARPDATLIRALRAAHAMVVQDATGNQVVEAAPGGRRQPARRPPYSANGAAEQRWRMGMPAQNLPCAAGLWRRSARGDEFWGSVAVRAVCCELVSGG